MKIKITVTLFKIMLLMTFGAVMSKFGINFPTNLYHFMAYAILGAMATINYSLNKKNIPIITFKDMFGDSIKLETKLSAWIAIILAISVALAIFLSGCWIGKNLM